MIQVAVCDDEPSILDMLVEFMADFKEKYGLEIHTRTFTQGKELLTCEDAYDIIFLDIKLQDMDGIALGSMLRKKDKKVKIIYLTASKEHMKKAFHVHAFDYLIKPVEKQTVHKVLLEAVTYDDMIADATITLQAKSGVVSLNVDVIQYFEYSNRSVYVYTCKNEVLELPRKKISNIAEKMNPYHFEVSHKSFVVNLHYVDTIKGYTIYLKGGNTIPLSQLYSKKFRKKMNEYLSTRI